MACTGVPPFSQATLDSASAPCRCAIDRQIKRARRRQRAATSLGRRLPGPGTGSRHHQCLPRRWIAGGAVGPNALPAARGRAAFLLRRFDPVDTLRRRTHLDRVGTQMPGNDPTGHGKAFVERRVISTPAQPQPLDRGAWRFFCPSREPPHMNHAAPSDLPDENLRLNQMPGQDHYRTFVRPPGQSSERKAPGAASFDSSSRWTFLSEVRVLSWTRKTWAGTR